MTAEDFSNALRDANPACDSCKTLSGLLVSEAEDNIQLVIEAERTVDLDAFQATTITWARATFPTTTVESTLKHLVREIGEVLKDPADIVEWADCYLLLMNAAAIAGHPVSAIVEAAKAKAAVNRSRKWGAPDADGVVEHVREAPVSHITDVAAALRAEGIRP